MYAVIQTGGKQYRVAPGQTLRVEKLPGEIGDPVRFSSVLLVSDGEKLSIGTPAVENAAVTAKIVEQDKATKVLIFKYKRRKRFRRKQGHRQPFTAVRIENIESAV
ncbi:MAG: 50S ribosomal protein L21 [Thermodesulfobacteriota bacterium]